MDAISHGDAAGRCLRRGYEATVTGAARTTARVHDEERGAESGAGYGTSREGGGAGVWTVKCAANGVHSWRRQYMRLH